MELERLLPIPLLNVLGRSIGRYTQQVVKRGLLRRHGGAEDDVRALPAKDTRKFK